MAFGDDGVITIRKPRRRTVAFVLAIAMVLTVAAVVVLNSTKRVELNGIAFDVPFSWTVHTEIPASTGFGSTIALIGTMPWGDCGTYDINCHFQERLSRDEIELDVGVIGLMDTDFCSFANKRPDLEPRTDGIRVSETHYFRIDGRPAIVTEYSLDTSDYYGSDDWRRWDIAPIDSTRVRYQISAKWRGPEESGFIAALDRLIASIDLTPSGYATVPVPDCGSPFPVAGGS
jgi:hypothetical protein